VPRVPTTYHLDYFSYTLTSGTNSSANIVKMSGAMLDLSASMICQAS